jgi:hypothetical protein
VSVLVGLLAIIALLGGAVAYFRQSYAKATIETLRENNAALTDRVSVLEGEGTRCATRLTAVESENTQLRTFVSGADAIKTLAESIAGQHSELMVRLTEIAEAVQAHILVDHARPPRPPRKRAATVTKATPRSSGR